MDDYTLVGILLAFIAGTYIGWKINDAIMRFTFRSMAEEAGLNSPEAADKFINHWRNKDGFEDDLEEVYVRIEKHKDTLYAYRKDDDAFLGQGSDKESLIMRMGEKLRGVRLVITPEDGADFIGGSFSFDVNTKEITSEKH